MNDIDSLLKRHGDKMIISEKAQKPLDVIRNIVDVKELPLETLSPTHLEFLKGNVINAMNYTNHPVRLHLYEIIDNLKSSIYYKSIEKDTRYLAYFKNPTVYIIVDESVGLMETNSSILMRDYKISSGITQEDFNKRGIQLLDYLSAFEIEGEK